MVVKSQSWIFSFRVSRRQKRKLRTPDQANIKSVKNKVCYGLREFSETVPINHNSWPSTGY